MHARRGKWANSRVTRDSLGRDGNFFGPRAREKKCAHFPVELLFFPRSRNVLVSLV